VGFAQFTAQVLAQPLADQGQPALRLQILGSLGQHVVQLVHPPPEHRVDQSRMVHRRADQGVAEHFAIQVEHPLAEALRPDRAAVVRNVRR
jgi:hypothetical protein